MKLSPSKMVCAALAGLLACMADAGAESIVYSKHNLSASSPNKIRARKETEICIFCHTPHNATSDAPLWNRYDSGAVYTPYSSTTTKAKIGQPTGASKLCLSCHDGTVALGKVRSRPDEIPFVGGIFRMPAGASNLGTDLSDDHPVSFRYDTALAKENGQLVDPGHLTGGVHLDNRGELQCTSCHNAHDDRYGNFLVRDNRASALCITCHDVTHWSESDHRNSEAKWNRRGPNPWPESQWLTVADNACANCHVPHNAQTRERLLRQPTEEENCYSCHNANVARKDIEAEFQKPSIHPVDRTTGVHNPVEDPINATRHVECVDCHNPHAANSNPDGKSGLSGALRDVEGINLAGNKVSPAQFEYEVCFRCHADSIERGAARVNRQFPETNTRREFDPSNASYHPVAAMGRNGAVPSLIEPMRPSSLIKCTDCHNSDASPSTGGSGPNGPHGSIYEPLLERRLSLTDGEGLSDQSGAALCYKCHSRDSIMGDQSFPTHSLHVGKGASCATCHDPHGVKQNTNLINFNPDYARPLNGVLQFTDTGNFSGNCTMTCHDHPHDNISYSPGNPGSSPAPVPTMTTTPAPLPTAVPVPAARPASPPSSRRR